MFKLEKTNKVPYGAKKSKSQEVPQSVVGKIIDD